MAFMAPSLPEAAIRSHPPAGKIFPAAQLRPAIGAFLRDQHLDVLGRPKAEQR